MGGTLNMAAPGAGRREEDGLTVEDGDLDEVSVGWLVSPSVAVGWWWIFSSLMMVVGEVDMSGMLGRLEGGLLRWKV